MVNSPNNPTGWVMERSDQQAVLDFARERGIWLIVDEVYARIVYAGRAAPSFVQLAEDGRLEHGVELPNGRSILPRHRFLNVDAEVDRWKISTMIEVDGQAIGRIRARRLADGRVELSFRDVNDAVITPAIHYVPAELPPGFWLRSSEIVAPPPAPAGEAAAEPEPGMEAEPEQATGTPALPSSGGGGAQ